VRMLIEGNKVTGRSRGRGHCDRARGPGFEIKAGYGNDGEGRNRREEKYLRDRPPAKQLCGRIGQTIVGCLFFLKFAGKVIVSRARRGSPFEKRRPEEKLAGHQGGGGWRAASLALGSGLEPARIFGSDS